jgi:uncharacterized protein
MGRLLILFALVVLAIWWLRRVAQGPAAPGARREAPARDELVRCAHCGLLLPRGEARQSAGALYCSEEHARLGASPR